MAASSIQNPASTRCGTSASAAEKSWQSIRNRCRAGGASTAQQYLRAGLVDEMELHVVPLLLGAGERLFENLDSGPAGFECVELVSSPAVAHYSYVRKGA